MKVVIVSKNIWRKSQKRPNGWRSRDATIFELYVRNCSRSLGSPMCRTSAPNKQDGTWLILKSQDSLRWPNNNWTFWRVDICPLDIFSLLYKRRMSQRARCVIDTRWMCKNRDSKAPLLIENSNRGGGNWRHTSGRLHWISPVVFSPVGKYLSQQSFNSYKQWFALRIDWCFENQSNPFSLVYLMEIMEILLLTQFQPSVHGNVPRYDNLNERTR